MKKELFALVLAAILIFAPPLFAPARAADGPNTDPLAAALKREEYSVSL